MSTIADQTHPFPLAVQVGFAGSRKFPKEFDDEILRQLVEHPSGLRGTLKLEPRHFLCGKSQLAIGADTFFARACQSLDIPQRLFLPQHRDEFLKAQGSSGPDFSEEQQAEAKTLLQSPHIIQERVVSDAANRQDRFHDVNLEILRVSDGIVCLVAAKPTGKAGGTNELISLAQKRKKPVLELTMEIEDGRPKLKPTWHGQQHFHIPELPHSIDTGARTPGRGMIPEDVQGGYDALKRLASDSARRQREYFRNAALIVIGAHLFATIIAVIALTQHTGLIPYLLSFELLLLAGGYWKHHRIHQTHAVEEWALTRLVAELARSAAAIGDFHTYLDYLFPLPFPQKLRPLLRTVSVLHLTTSRRCQEVPWEESRRRYLTSRLTDASKNAQILYLEKVKSIAVWWLKSARTAFTIGSVGAFAVTTIKLLIICHCLRLSHDTGKRLAMLLGGGAVVLPVIAVAALSLAAAFGLEARHHTSQEILRIPETPSRVTQQRWIAA